MRLKNSEILGLYNEVDWDEVIANLGEPDMTHAPETTNWTQWETMEDDGNEMKVVFENWKKANFNLAAIRWNNHYADTSYPTEIEDKLANHLGLKGVFRSWVSKMDPGCMAPWHFDGEDKVGEWLQIGEPQRFVVTMSKPAHGHIFILGEDYYFNNPQGTLFKWDYFREWHSGINAGMVPKYQFHLIGYY